MNTPGDRGYVRINDDDSELELGGVRGHDTKHELSAGNVVHLHFACKQDGEYVAPAHVLADAVRLD